MNFLLSEEQIEMQRSLQRLLDKACPSTHLHAIFNREESHDLELWQQLVAMGVAGLHLPEKFGGVGLELIDLAVMAEGLGAAAAPVPFFGHVLAGLAISLGGSDEQKAQWLPKIAGGDILASIAVAEGERQWQPEQWRVQADETLSATKRFVPHGQWADLLVIGLGGGRLGLVNLKEANVERRALDMADRTRPAADIRFEAAKIELLPCEAEVAYRLRDAALVLLAADAFGGASRCVTMAVEYAKVREQFGVPIGQFQALKHQLANMAVDVEPARGLYWYAAHSFDHLLAEAPRAAALAKSHLTDRFLQVARDTVEAHGGIGYTWESDVQIYFKRAMFDYAYFGPPVAHRARAADLAGW